jgi:hypothetical protein
MNCLEFRRHLGSEPASTLVDFVAHRLECVHCAAAHARAEEFEVRIRKAASVAVPTNLADRILLAQTTELRHERRGRRRGIAAMLVAAAASVVVALVAVNQPQPEVPALAGMVIEHLEEHVISAAKAADPVAKQDVEAAFADRGVHLASIPDGINYVHKCPAGPYSTVHMVMPEPGGPVSVVYVADKTSAGRVDFVRNGMHGRELPLGKGSLVMLARADAGFDAIEAAWQSAMAATPSGVDAVSLSTDRHLQESAAAPVLAAP